MSPDNAGTFTDAATLAHLIAIHRPEGENDSSVLDDASSESFHAKDPMPPRPVSPARVARSRNAHSRAFNDPSNYLG
jgi:hypothetical protein